MKLESASLYHLAERENLLSILEHGLMSATQLLQLTRNSGSEPSSVLRNHRPDLVRLSPSVMIRDQRPMPPGALARALEDGLEPSDWYTFINGFVFFWLDLERVSRQRRACGDRPQIVMTFDSGALLDRFGDHARVSPINSGNARRKPAKRGRKTLVPYKEWTEKGWSSGRRARRPVEVLFGCIIPAQPPFLVRTKEV